MTLHDTSGPSLRPGLPQSLRRSRSRACTRHGASSPFPLIPAFSIRDRWGGVPQAWVSGSMAGPGGGRSGKREETGGRRTQEAHIDDPALKRSSDCALARISHQCHGLRGAVGPAGKESCAARCGASGKRLDAPCRPDSAALRVAPRRPPAASRASTVGTATLFGPLLADRTPGRDAGRDIGEKSGLAAPGI